ncbi:MAG: DHA2 family efflux MFS transporter permease subunit [Geminicoccaceae bacterium]|nr:DHA2 family efflux MFS transporter permease subunit [Geminicoccaceae bacterium]
MSASSGQAMDVPHRGLITVSVMLATVMQVLDTTIANVALPTMTGDLGASPDTITWVLTSYIVAAAIMTPLTGWLADRIGRKQLFLVSIVGFVVTSMACGLARNLDMMVLFRILQGLFGAAIVPLSQTFLLDINPKERHGQAMAMWGAGIMVGPIIGPTLGGWLTEALNWRWVFFINLPVGILAFLGSAGYLPHIATRLRKFDFFGFAMLSLGVGALQLMLDRGGEVDWFDAYETWIELGFSIAGFWVFIVHSVTSDEPFIDPRIFLDRNFTTGLVFIFIVGIILLASLALLPPMLASVFGYPTITSGEVMAPRGVGTMISMILVGRLMHHVDPRFLIVTGLTLICISLWMMTGFSPDIDSTPIIVSGVIQGLGLGLVFVPLSTVAFATLDGRFRTDGTALFSLVRNIGSSIGISITSALWTHNVQVNHSELVANIHPFNPLLKLAAPAAITGDPATLARLDGLIGVQARMISYLDDFKFMLIISAAAILLVFFLDRPERSKGGQAAAPPPD